VAPPKRAGAELWVVRRSSKHPRTSALLGEQCWVEFSNGQPVHFIDFHSRYWRALALEREELAPPEFEEEDEEEEEEQLECRQVRLVDALAMSPGIVSIALEHASVYFPLNERSRKDLALCLLGATIDDADWSSRRDKIESALKIPTPETLLAALRMQLEEDPWQRSSDFLAGGYYKRRVFEVDD
jgi:hypothetical protein